MSLKDERLRCGLTQAEVAQEFNISEAAVSQWESGISFPNSRKLIRLAELYGCSIERLLEGEKHDDT